MAPRRRAAILIAFAAGVLVVLIIVLLAGGSGSMHGPTATTRSATQDPRAADRAAIQRTAIAYQLALRPGSHDDPCNYVTAALRTSILAAATGDGNSCAAEARKEDSLNGPPIASIRPLGVVSIAFGPFYDIRQGADASAYWQGSANSQILFMHQGGRWLIGGG